ncbi:hypothetical protein KJ966_29325 [bacterium]|nr:hypothetical protein [bacterium]
MTAFLEIGVSGATVLDSIGMGHIISQNIPIFAGLREAFAGSSPNHKLILVVIEEDMVTKVAEALADICVDIEDIKSYFMATFSIDQLFGFNNS